MFLQGCGGSNDKEKCEELQHEITKMREEQKEKEAQSKKVKELEEKIQEKEEKQSKLRVQRGQNQFDESDPLSDIKLTPEEQIKVDSLILKNLKYLNQPEHKEERDVRCAAG